MNVFLPSTASDFPPTVMDAGKGMSTESRRSWLEEKSLILKQNILVTTTHFLLTFNWDFLSICLVMCALILVSLLYLYFFSQRDAQLWCHSTSAAEGGASTSCPITASLPQVGWPTAGPGRGIGNSKGGVKPFSLQLKREWLEELSPRYAVFSTGIAPAISTLALGKRKTSNYPNACIKKMCL